MAMILVSIQSAQNWKGALGILDPETGLRYLQIDPSSPLVKNSQPRGVAVIKNRIYVNSAASIRIYRFDDRKNKPLLNLEKEVILNEWLLGETLQANLVSIVASEEKNRLYVGNNNFCAIDELDLEGSFIRRQHLWEIAPDIFPLPSHTGPKVIYGRIRNLSLSTWGDLYITIADCNNSGTGRVISLDTGEELVGELHDPHDGLFSGDHFYLHDIDHGTYLENQQSGKLYAYRVSPGRAPGKSDIQWAIRPQIAGEGWKDSIQNLRGMTLIGNTLYCGVTHFGKSTSQQVPSRVVAFHADSGIQQKEYFLPDLTLFREPRVLFMAALADQFTVQWKQDLHVYVHGKPEKPEFFAELHEKRPEDSSAGENDATEKKRLQRMVKQDTPTLTR